MILIHSIADILIAILLVIGVMAAVKNPENFFGEKEQWFTNTSREAGKYMTMVCVGIFTALAIVVEAIIKKLKKWKDKIQDRKH